MNIEQVSAVVAKVFLGDNRKIDAKDEQALVLREWEQTIGDLDYDAAIEAVVMHRRSSPDWITAAHIRANVKLLQARWERDARIQSQAARRALPAPVITLDMAKLQADTQASIREHRILRGVDPETGKPFEPVTP